MRLPDQLSAAQSAAVVEVIKFLAAHGRAIRLAREGEQAEKEKMNHPQLVGEPGADDSQNATAQTLEVYACAKTF